MGLWLWLNEGPGDRVGYRGTECCRKQLLSCSFICGSLIWKGLTGIFVTTVSPTPPLTTEAFIHWPPGISVLRWGGTWPLGSDWGSVKHTEAINLFPVCLYLCTVSSLPRAANSSQNLGVMPAWGPSITIYCPPTPVLFQQHIGTEVPMLLTYKWPTLAAIHSQNPLPPHED